MRKNSQTNNWVRLTDTKIADHHNIKEFLDIALANIPDNRGYESVSIYKNPKSQSVMLHHFGRRAAMSSKIDKRLLRILDKNDFNFVFRVQKGRTQNTPYGHVIIKPYQNPNEFAAALGAATLMIGPEVLTDRPVKNPLGNGRDGIIIEEYLSATEGWHPLYLQRKTVARDVATSAVKKVFTALHGPGMRCVYYREGIEYAESNPKIWASEIWKHVYFNSITGEAKLIDFGSTEQAPLSVIEKEGELVESLLREMDKHNF